jgi:pyruvate ferredoxin oxidoreductase gamma subunit
MLANAFVVGGKYASVFPSFGVERRGSAVMAFARFGDSPIRERTRVYRPDILLMLDQSLTENRTYYDGFKAGGIIVAATNNEQNIINLNLKPRLLATVDGMSIAMEETGIAVTNTCMLGAFAKATNLVRLEDLKNALASYFAGDLLDKNICSMERGYSEVKVTYFELQETAAEQETAACTETLAIAMPNFAGPFPAAWDDVDKKMLNVKTGEWRFRRPEVNKAACRLCGWCSIYCPAGCIQLREDGYYHRDLEYCKGCGVCVHECPAQAVKLQAEEVI